MDLITNKYNLWSLMKETHYLCCKEHTNYRIIFPGLAETSETI